MSFLQILVQIWIAFPQLISAQTIGLQKKICEDYERRWYKWQRNVPRCQLLLLDISRLVTRIMQEK